MTERSSGRIRILPDSVARQIAAGEVIDRPFSVVRELLDNAIDSGATSIDVYIEAGGVGSVRIVDNGFGMTKTDLDLCRRPHATSKIERVEDLDNLSSLGFRGEALSSIAACSRLSVTSRTAEEPTAHRIRVESGKLLSLTEAPGEVGTIVEAADLFYSLPARRKFLKTPSAETAMCRAVLIEKSLAFPKIAFRLFTGGTLKLFLPAVSTIGERIAAAHPSIVDPTLMHRVESRGENYSLSVVMGGPSLYRKDRRYIWTYVNSRKISEFSLVQAVEYGFADHIPGGNFPIAFVFLSIRPELVDFNVHPTKREARFRNLPELHHALATTLKAYLQDFSVGYAHPPSAGDRAGTTHPANSDLYVHDSHETADAASPPAAPSSSATSFVRHRSNLPTTGTPAQTPHPLPGSAAGMSEELEPRPAPPTAEDIRYYGQVFGLFLLASVAERLFIIDQHAAHERILFERFRASPRKPQHLLVPIAFEATNDEERNLENNIDFCSTLGIEMRRSSPGNWEIHSLPEGFQPLEAEVVSFVKQAKGTRRELEQELYARMSCRAAVKEGDSIDEISATELIRQAFALSQARCPHGRPIWYELSRRELYHLVGRL